MMILRRENACRYGWRRQPAAEFSAAETQKAKTSHQEPHKSGIGPFNFGAWLIVLSPWTTPLSSFWQLIRLLFKQNMPVPRLSFRQISKKIMHMGEQDLMNPLLMYSEPAVVQPENWNLFCFVSWGAVGSVLIWLFAMISLTLPYQTRAAAQLFRPSHTCRKRWGLLSHDSFSANHLKGSRSGS